MKTEIPINYEIFQALKKDTESLGITVDDHAESILRQWLDETSRKRATSDYVLNKNAELYDRLAKT